MKYLDDYIIVERLNSPYYDLNTEEQIKNIINKENKKIYVTMNQDILKELETHYFCLSIKDIIGEVLIVTKDLIIFKPYESNLKHNKINKDIFKNCKSSFIGMGKQINEFGPKIFNDIFYVLLTIKGESKDE